MKQIIFNNKNSINYANKMKCYTDKELANTCAKLTGNKNIKNLSNKSSIFLTIVVICCVVITLFFLWLVEKGIFSNIMLNIKSFIVSKKIIYQ